MKMAIESEIDRSPLLTLHMVSWGVRACVCVCSKSYTCISATAILCYILMKLGDLKILYLNGSHADLYNPPIAGHSVESYQE